MIHKSVKSEMEKQKKCGLLLYGRTSQGEIICRRHILMGYHMGLGIMFSTEYSDSRTLQMVPYSITTIAAVNVAAR
jgi:hypothetical protein